MTTYPGALALLGSGEYTAAMDETDRALLAPYRPTPSVALLPTASGLEPGMPATWNDRGAQHFARLGAMVAKIPLVVRQDAFDASLLDLLSGHQLYYFSGGQPDYVIETLCDTPAWALIRAARADGAALAGCSAGAMMLGGSCLSVRSIRAGDSPRYTPGLGVVPQLAILPHFDRMRGLFTPQVFERALASAPAGVTLVGIDEDTALVWSNETGWRVSGRRGVTIFAAGGALTLTAGQTAKLDAPQNKP